MGYWCKECGKWQGREVGVRDVGVRNAVSGEEGKLVWEMLVSGAKCR